MAGSTRHEAQSLDSNPGDAFLDVSEDPFAPAPPFQHNIPLESKGLRAFRARGGLEGLERSLQTDRQNRPAHNEKASNSISMDYTASRTLTRWEDIAMMKRTLSILQARIPRRRTFSIARERDRLPIMLLIPSVGILLSLYLNLHALAAFLTTLRYLLIVGLFTNWMCALTIRRDMIRHISAGDIQPLEPSDLVPADGILVQRLKVARQNSFATRESDLVRELANHDVYEAVNRTLKDGRLRRDDGPDPFILSDRNIPDRIVNFSVTVVSQNTRSHQVVFPVSDSTPPETHFDDDDYAFAFLSLSLMACVVHNEKDPSVKLGPLCFLFLVFLVRPHRCRLKIASHQVLDLVSRVERALSIKGGRGSRRHWKSVITLLALLYNTPAVALAWTPIRALRIASGVTASGAAAGVIPLRTIDGVPSWAWISYLFVVILLAIHFAIALAQSSPTLVEGFTVFGPMVLTVTTFLVSLLFGAIAAMEPRGNGGVAEENTTDTSLRPANVAMTALGMYA